MATGTTISEEPEVIIRKLLVDYIDPSTIGIDFDPARDTSTGRSEGPEQPGTITVTPGDEGVVDGGTSGQTSMVGGGAGVHQHRRGTVYVDCWGGSVNDWATADPQDVRKDLKNAVYDALSVAYQGTRRVITDDVGNSQTVQELTSVVPTDHTPIPDPEESPGQRYGYRVFVGYTWERTSPSPSGSGGPPITF